MDRFWLKHYPPGVPADVDVTQYRSLVHLIDDGLARFAARDAYAFMDRKLSFAEVDRQSAAFGAWLQGRGLAPGARVALMMPNVPQYPIALAGVLRAGCVVVNVNPLYTPRELEHQLRDSGAEAIVILENFATTLQQVIAKTAVRHVVVASIGDLLGFPKGAITNFAIRRIKKMVPAVHAARSRALQRRRRRRRPAHACQAGGRARRHRVPAVHRRDDRCVEGSDPAAPEHGRQRPAARGLGQAGARRLEPRPRARAVRVRLRIAALPRVRAGRELPGGHPARYAERTDRKPARHPRFRRASSPSTGST